MNVQHDRSAASDYPVLCLKEHCTQRLAKNMDVEWSYTKWTVETCLVTNFVGLFGELCQNSWVDSAGFWKIGTYISCAALY